MIIRQKLEIIFQESNYFAINKPTNIETYFPNFQLIYHLDPELSGTVLLANDKKTGSILRNNFGSNQMTFYFLIIAQTVSTLGNEIMCDLPIAQHRQNSHMLISHRTGKKSLTKFKQLETLKSYTIWMAETHFLRRHQIRLHAHEVGIPIYGENFYNQIPVPFLSDFKKYTKLNRKGAFLALYPSVCIHLSKINFLWENRNLTIEAPIPDKLKAMLKIIKKWN